ncbi:putative addiction module antidote protein [Marispirochaeta aestuarii]|uniref:Putative addiction module antidote protein n=1 Tax=Marispirochaeta aestuarii TaxID=1963862 RepID=A0A1Y1RTX7_9SPIO|nr:MULTISPECIES: addiction module antidote protein [Marispirochaeta]ORC29589.1 putative addiction module antidote protein [Marispirochaeta aestuarii]
MREYRNFVKDVVKDSNESSLYLEAALEEYEHDGNLSAFLKAIRTVVDAQGGMTILAEKTELNRQHLYRSLSETGNPTIRTLNAVLLALGLKLSIQKAS